MKRWIISFRNSTLNVVNKYPWDIHLENCTQVTEIRFFHWRNKSVIESTTRKLFIIRTEGLTGPLHSRSRRINCWPLFNHDSLFWIQNGSNVIQLQWVATWKTEERTRVKKKRRRERAEREKMERDTVQVEKMNASPLDTPHYSVSAIFPTFSHF